MRDLTVTSGAVSLEQRMIGWRVGWMVARAELAPSLAMVHIYNGVVTTFLPTASWCSHPLFAAALFEPIRLRASA